MPNILPPQALQSLPNFLQRNIVLGLDLQGGSHILLEVDTKAVQKERLETLRDDVRRVMRDARIGYTNLAIQGTERPAARPRAERRAGGVAPNCASLSHPIGGASRRQPDATSKSSTRATTSSGSP